MRTFFIQGNKNKVTGGQIRWIERVGHEGHAFLGQKLLNTQHGVSRYAPITHHKTGKFTEGVFQKKFTEVKRSLSQQCQMVH